MPVCPFVQVHPTAFVDPKDEGAGVKFLGPETLRGVGGILLNARGERFVNELATRDEVTAAIWRHCGSGSSDGGAGGGGGGDADAVRRGAVAYVVLTPAAVEAFGTAMFKFYHATKKFFTAVDGAGGLAGLLPAGGGATAERVAATLQGYAAAAAGGRDEFGKTVFPVNFAGAEAGPLYVAKVTPAIHYTMGTCACVCEGVMK